MLCVLVIIGAYETMHYHTAGIAMVLRKDHTCTMYDRHYIGKEPAPEWVERYLFWPAEKVGNLFRSRPWNGE